ncbi:Hypothetical predicted protein, partial [Pelobates cultripes]
LFVTQHSDAKPASCTSWKGDCYQGLLKFKVSPLGKQRELHGAYGADEHSCKLLMQRINDRTRQMPSSPFFTRCERDRYNGLSTEMDEWGRDEQPKPLMEAAQRADEYLDARRPQRPTTFRSYQPLVRPTPPVPLTSAPPSRSLPPPVPIQRAPKRADTQCHQCL